MKAPTDQHLVFQLDAPLASWGEIAVGETRPSADRPTRSCLAGLIAACCGIRRDQEADLRALDGLRFAYRMDAAGLPLHDYHTIQVPKTKTGVRYRTRRDELTWNRRSELGTILSSRAYRMEVSVVVVVNRLSSAPELCPSLTDIAKSMDQPIFTPYLGRRSCPLAMPLRAVVVVAADFNSAVRVALDDPSRNEWNALCETRPTPADTVRWFWEEGCLSPFSVQRSHYRYDRTTSQAHRLFADRIEHEAVVQANL